MNSVKIDSKLLTPSKIVCIGRNYVAHIKELNNDVPESMVVFNKPNSAVSDTLHYISEDCRFEGEICFSIKDEKIYGVGFGLDLTKANIQKYMKAKGLPWERAKSFDKSAVLSDFVKLEYPLESLRMTLHIDDALIQFANYELMIYKPEVMLEEIKSFMSLEDGDIIMSGTPKGVGNFTRGQCFVGRIYANDDVLVKKEWVVV